MGVLTQVIHSGELTGLSFVSVGIGVVGSDVDLFEVFEIGTDDVRFSADDARDLYMKTSYFYKYERIVIIYLLESISVSLRSLNESCGPERTSRARRSRFFPVISVGVVLCCNLIIRFTR